MSAPTSAVQRLNMFWFLVLSAPLLIGIAIAGLVWFGNYTASIEWLPQDTLRTGAMGAMALMLVIARPLRNALLAPSTIAQRSVQTTTPADPAGDTAVFKVQASMFMLLGILDAVSMIVIALSLMQADALLALLNGVYTLVLAIIARPDFAALLDATRNQLTQKG
ncbi:MAG: hypothetical protein AOY29_08410 [Alcanivorax borkumensis]|jgi:hypothetical protein|uniref:Transmembrane protein n=2 Tax=Alcanivoracaceae TaxID=224372 RepID=Q0VTG7_ALCBS|nr:hypothetical protein Y017_06970 [Alcanivorax sp. 97CO-5]OJH08820.1 MAG: hypothetical protein AOY29_08410 [Alcanivorax borkumensis]CAL15495.1 hypothetical protein predicted by Glimmer/Critica [Alcanivorax borkumensis SK2]